MYILSTLGKAIERNDTLDEANKGDSESAQ
jgi:hypothetical protein